MSIKSVLLTTAISVASLTVAHATPIELVTNGGFETGDLSGWTVSGPTGTPTSCQTNWTVSTNGGNVGCAGHNPGNPVVGNYAAYTANDGAGPLTYELMQNIFVPINTVSGQLSFDWTADTADSNRKFSVFLNGMNVFQSTASTNDIWTLKSVDVSQILASAAGTSISITFDNYIPSRYTGCCNALGLDQVSLQATAKVPEPNVLALFGLGLLGFAVSRRKSAKSKNA